MFIFPWSNLHELNLDWILQQVKRLIESNDEFNEKADYAVETADEAKEIAEEAAQAILPDGSVTTAKLADYAVTQNKLAVNAVGNYQLQNGSVTNDKIGTDAVTNDKIGTDAVTTGKIADGNVTEAKLNNNLIKRIPLLKKIQNLFNDQNPAAITVPNNARSLLIITSSESGEPCMIFIYSTGSGVVKYSGLSTLPAIYTFTTTTNKLEITSSTLYNKTIYAVRLENDELEPYTP